MKVTATALPGVLLIEPAVYADDRGYFGELYHLERYRQAGIAKPFVQDNLSQSRHGVLRGLHLQHPRAQGKLVCVLEGEVFDVAVDVRRHAPTFGRWTGYLLSASNRHQLYIPEGFAHGFCVTSESALVLYKCTDLYDPASEVSVAADDPDIGIDWPVSATVISAKDAAAPKLAEIPAHRLPPLDAGG